MMKFPIVEKYQRIAFIAIKVIIIIGFSTIGLLMYYGGANIVDVWNELSIILQIFLAFLFIGGIFSWIGTANITYTHVEINDKGIELRCGKLVLNKMLWQDIKWVEIFKEQNIYVLRRHISIAKSDNQEYKERRIFFVQNLTRKKITFLYNKQAIDLIREHYDRYIHGEELIRDKEY